MNYTLKELTSIPFEDWASLIEIEDTSLPFIEDLKEYTTLHERESIKYHGTITLSTCFNFPISDFSIHP